MDASAPHITPRQQEVAVLIAQGYTYAAAAEALCVSEYTLTDHVKAVYRTLGLYNRSELSLWCAHVGLLDVDTAGAALADRMRVRREEQGA